MRCHPSAKSLNDSAFLLLVGLGHHLLCCDAEGKFSCEVLMTHHFTLKLILEELRAHLAFDHRVECGDFDGMLARTDIVRRSAPAMTPVQEYFKKNGPRVYIAERLGRFV